MSSEKGLSSELVNTQYASLAAIFVHYQRKGTLQPLEEVQFGSKIQDFSPADKLSQLLMSVLAGCHTLSEVNTRQAGETVLAKACGWPHFADQSNLSRLLDGLTLKQLEQLRMATTRIWRTNSRVQAHDWRGYLLLDYDLSGLPCGAKAEASQKGYFSDKKTPVEANWPASVESSTVRPSGPMYSQATFTRCIFCNQPSGLLKML